MRVSIFGLGYVGAITGVCLAREGHDVIGVDPDEHKLNLLRKGESPVVEDGINEMLGEVLAAGRFRVTGDWNEAIAQSEISLVCVGTPSRENGSLQTDHVQSVAQQIGEAIKAKGSYHSVVIRSTVLPGTTESLVRPILEEATGGTVYETFGLSMNPEFLREGQSVHDFYNPPYTLIGTHDRREFDRVKELYRGCGGECYQVQIATAEAVKYGCNIFHALKITFANEMGMLGRRLGVDANEVLEMICRDTKLNISTKYMKPGFAFGGSCLPKDLRAFSYAGRFNDIPLPTFEGILASNKAQIEAVAKRIMSKGCRKIALMGLAFKERTDDLRESPLVALAELLIGRGYDLRIYDPNVHYSALYGANKRYVDHELPHLGRILVSAPDALNFAELVVFGHGGREYRELAHLLQPHHKVFDLARVGADEPVFNGHEYEGLYW